MKYTIKQFYGIHENGNLITATDTVEKANEVIERLTKVDVLIEKRKKLKVEITEIEFEMIALTDEEGVEGIDNE